MNLDISCDFSGGNIVYEKEEGDVVFLHQDLRDTGIDWFYWYFGVNGASGRRVKFSFTCSRALGVSGPGVSYDKGETWRWLGKEACVDDGFVFDFPENCGEVRFSFGMPYQFARWKRFEASHVQSGRLKCVELCETRKGRKLEAALIGDEKHEPEWRIAITCRHHCCEMMAGYTVEGFARWLMNSPEPRAELLREKAQVLIVPFADLDGVEEGDQGKGRKPRDHGRDYDGKSIYPETTAIMEFLSTWGKDKLAAAFDMHCPWICGEHNECIYAVGSPDKGMDKKQRVFSDIMENHAVALPFAADDFLAFGQSWNNEANMAGGRSFSRWAATLPGIGLATSIEIPYANARGAEVNQESALSFGEDFGSAIATYLTSTGKL